MVLNIVIGSLIFGYAGWVLVRYASKSREGKCASCSSKSHCAMPGCEPEAKPRKSE